ncbi:hypothetical protein V8F20_009339 [Naviculisporaceae sp. PSN 640]
MNRNDSDEVVLSHKRATTTHSPDGSSPKKTAAAVSGAADEEIPPLNALTKEVEATTRPSARNAGDWEHKALIQALRDDFPAVNQIDQNILDLERLLKEKNYEADDWHCRALESEKKVEKLEMNLRKKEMALAIFEGSVPDPLISDLQRKLREQEEKYSEAVRLLGAAIEEQDRVTDERDEAIQAIHDRDEVIRQRDETIQELEEAIWQYHVDIQQRPMGKED